MSRSTQGVTLINLGEGEKLAGLERVVETEDERRGGVAGGDAGPPTRDRSRDEPTPPTTDDHRPATPSSPRHRAAIDALDREILARLNARAAHAQAIGALKARRRRLPPRARGAGARAAAGARTAGRCPNEAVAGVFRAGDVGVPRARAAAAHRLPRSGRHVLARGGGQALRRSSSRPCRARRSTRCSARSRAGRPTTPSSRSRTRPRAPSAARSTSCARRRCRSAARSSCASRRTCCRTSAALGRGHAGLFARAVARAVRAVARAAPAAACRASPSRATPRRRGSPPASPAPRRSPARSPRRSTASPMLAPHIEDEPNNTTRFWVLGRQAVPPSGKRRDLARDVGAEPAGRRLRAARAVRAARRQSMSRLESRPARTGLWEYLFFVDLVGHATTRSVAAALAELREKAPFLKLLGSYPAAVYWNERTAMHRLRRRPRPRSRALAPDYVRSIAPYVPGKPIDELAREFGLDRGRHRQARVERESARAGPGGARGDRRRGRRICRAIRTATASRSRRRWPRASASAAERHRARQRLQRHPRARDAGVPAAGRRRRLLAARVRRLPARHAGARRARHRGAGARLGHDLAGDARGDHADDARSCSSPIRTIRPAPGSRRRRSRRSSRRCRRTCWSCSTRRTTSTSSRRQPRRQRARGSRRYPNLIVSRTFSKALRARGAARRLRHHASRGSPTC